MFDLYSIDMRLRYKLHFSKLSTADLFGQVQHALYLVNSLK